MATYTKKGKSKSLTSGSDLNSVLSQARSGLKPASQRKFKNSPKSKSFQVMPSENANASSAAVQARWSFSPGQLFDIEDDDDYWDTLEPTETEIETDSDCDSSIASKSDEHDSIASTISDLEEHDEIKEEEEEAPPPPVAETPPPPSRERSTSRERYIRDRYKAFRELSVSRSPTRAGKTRLTIASPVLSYASPRASLMYKQRDRETRSLRNRSSIRESLRSIMDLEDDEMDDNLNQPAYTQSLRRERSIKPLRCQSLSVGAQRKPLRCQSLRVGERSVPLPPL